MFDIWAEWIWFPEGSGWKNVTSNSPTDIFPRPLHILLPIPCAFLVLLLRRIFEFLFFYPFGHWMGSDDKKPRQAEPDVQLEKLFLQLSKSPNSSCEAVIEAHVKRSDMCRRDVDRWLRRRSRWMNTQSSLDKFAECSWRFTAYLGMFLYGLYVLHDKPWSYDNKLIWYKVVNEPVDLHIFIYYMLELSFYWSLCVTQFMDARRKDFMQMFLHHVTTILLMSGSYISNLVRIGALVICVHDVVDFFLDGAKMAKYLKLDNLCTATFVVFYFVWIYSRLYLYPTWLLRTAIFDSHEYYGDCLVMHTLRVLLCLLQIMHILWFILITRIAIASLKGGMVERDFRSDTDESDSTEEKEKQGDQKYPTGHLEVNRNLEGPNVFKLRSLEEFTKNGYTRDGLKD